MPAIKEGNTDGGVTASSFPPVLLPTTIQMRLDTGNIGKGGGQRGSLTRCAQKFGTFQSKLRTPNPDASELESSKEELEKELAYYQLEISKQFLLQRNMLQQVQRNQTQEQQRLDKIRELKEQVEKIETEAQACSHTRKCCEEYEALAKLANDKFQSTSRVDLENQIEESSQELERLQEEEHTTDHLLSTRGAQFQLLMQYITDLKESLADKEEEEQIIGSASKFTKKSVDGNDPMDVDGEDGLYGDL